MGDWDGDTNESLEEQHQEQESATADLQQENLVIFSEDSRLSGIDVDNSRDTGDNSDPLEEVYGRVSSRDNSDNNNNSSTTGDRWQGDTLHTFWSSPYRDTLFEDSRQSGIDGNNSAIPHAWVKSRPGHSVNIFRTGLMIMSFAARHHITGTALGNLLEMINTMFGQEVVPQTKYMFNKIFKDS